MPNTNRTDINLPRIGTVYDISFQSILSWQYILLNELHTKKVE